MKRIIMRRRGLEALLGKLRGQGEVGVSGGKGAWPEQGVKRLRRRKMRRGRSLRSELHDPTEVEFRLQQKKTRPRLDQD